LKADGDKVDYATRGQRVFDGIVKNLKFHGADGQILTAGKSGKVPPGQVNGSGNGGGNNVTEAFRYFYHPDHLGSTSYITDASGEVYQQGLSHSNFISCCSDQGTGLARQKMWRCERPEKGL
jgi:hypothetical protein